MKKGLCIIIVILLILFLIFAVGFKIKLEVKKYNEAKQATEITAIERLGEGCMLVSRGMYLGPPPFSRGFWFGFVDKEELEAIVYTAVPTLDGKDWYVREYLSQWGGDYHSFFARFE